MDFRAAKGQSAPKWAWARTGALIVFLVTGVLLLASLHSARSERLPSETHTATLQNR
jgi:hypothetical protein